ncbi:MAG: hypothetical protein JWQ78_467, partial [Sediminibacterium sp.]|nr:hypothetical protein [Sediminibacterium sp.]
NLTSSPLRTLRFLRVLCDPALRSLYRKEREGPQ